MLGKLAFRNARRQGMSYAVYFVTVSLAVAMMFAVNNMIFADALNEIMVGFAWSRYIFAALTGFVAVAVAFVIGYASSYLLRLRKREFGTYLTLGMDRGGIIRLYTVETLVIATASLAVGILLGMVVYQAFMAIVVTMCDVVYVPQGYSWQGFALTACVVAATYLFSAGLSVWYLKRVSVNDLLKADRKVNRADAAKSKFWFAVLWSSMAVMTAAIIVVFWDFEQLRWDGMLMFASLAVFTAAYFMLHVAGAKGVIPMLLKNKKFKSKGVNTFILRSLSSKLNSSAVMFGLLAVLLTAACVLTSVANTIRLSSTVYADSYPSVTIQIRNPSDLDKPTLDEAVRLIGEHDSITRQARISGYGADRTVYKQSDFAAVAAFLGQQSPAVSDGFVVLTLRGRDYLGPDTLEINGKTYARTDTVSVEDIFKSVGLGGPIYILPDSALEGMPPTTETGLFYVASPRKSCMALESTLRNRGGWMWGVAPYINLKNRSEAAVWMVGCSYLAITFVLIAMAILGLKSLSDAVRLRTDFRVLKKIGLDENGATRTLLKYISAFFLTPFILPFVLNVPVAILCYRTMAAVGVGGHVLRAILGACGVTALILAGLYVCYMLASYLACKKVLRIKEDGR